MRQMEIAIGLIEQDGKYHLQLRDGDPTIGAAGMIGCFGGKVEEGESPGAAFWREINEEVGLEPSAEAIKKLGVVDVLSDHRLEPVRVIAHVFHILVDRAIDVRTNEGQLITWSRDEAADNLHRMTPGTKACFEQFVITGVI